MHVRRHAWWLLVPALLLAACHRAPTELPPQAQSASPSTNAGAGTRGGVVASVNGSPITRAELDYARRRLLAKGPASGLPAEAERKLLESLVASRAIALEAEQQLSEDERAALAVQVAAYREELLVKRYLNTNVTTEPISSAEVAAYYKQHPEELGGGEETSFEYVYTVGVLSADDRHRLLRELSELNQRSDWSGWVEERHSPNLSYRRAKARSSVLDQPLRQLVEDTAEGKVSAVHNGKQLMVVRVTSATRIPPRPLDEVRAEIRRKLAPMQLREAVKAISDQAVGAAKVEYSERGRG